MNPPLRRRCLLGLIAAAPLAGCTTTAAPPPRRDWFVFLETGRPTPDDREAVMRMQRGHIDNFKRLFERGELQAAGPLRDPSRTKRGIVVVRAASLDELRGYFAPDDYVREGYMQLNAVPARVNRGLATEGIDPSGVEEVRIAMLSRAPAEARVADRLRALLDAGTVRAWYTLEAGPIAEVMFARAADDAALRSALAPFGDGATIWSQWLGRGVVR